MLSEYVDALTSFQTWNDMFQRNIISWFRERNRQALNYWLCPKLLDHWAFQQEESMWTLAINQLREKRAAMWPEIEEVEKMTLPIQPLDNQSFVLAVGAPQKK